MNHQHSMEHSGNPLALIVGSLGVFFNALFEFIPLPTTYEGKILQAVVLALIGFATTKLCEKFYNKYIKKSK
jgi:uncharacterized protein (DUF697 family)